jgi:hypothetical protein
MTVMGETWNEGILVGKPLGKQPLNGRNREGNIKINLRESI